MKMAKIGNFCIVRNKATQQNFSVQHRLLLHSIIIIAYIVYKCVMAILKPTV